MALVACRLHKRSAVRCVRDACTVYACLRLLTSRAMSLHLTPLAACKTLGPSQSCEKREGNTERIVKAYNTLYLHLQPRDPPQDPAARARLERVREALVQDSRLRDVLLAVDVVLPTKIPLQRRRRHAREAVQR